MSNNKFLVSRAMRITLSLKIRSLVAPRFYTAHKEQTDD